MPKFKLPRCPVCGDRVHLMWDDKTREAYVEHQYEVQHNYKREYRSPSRRETAAAWCAWVERANELKAKWNEPMVWDGFNTRQVVAYCVSWEYQLCGIYSISPRLDNGQAGLNIEPADTMRGHSLHIPIGSMVSRVKKGYYQYIEVSQPKRYALKMDGLNFDDKGHIIAPYPPSFFPSIDHSRVWKTFESKYPDKAKELAGFCRLPPPICITPFAPISIPYSTAYDYFGGSPSTAGPYFWWKTHHPES